MRASIYYKITWASAAVATLSAVFFDYPGIPQVLPGLISVFAALTALAANFINYKKARSDHLDILNEDFPTPQDPLIVRYRSKPFRYNRDAEAKDKSTFMARTFDYEITRLQSYHIIPRAFKDTRVDIFLNPKQDFRWTYYVLLKEVGHWLDESELASRNTDLEIYRLLLGGQAEPKATTILKREERLEREIDDLLQQRLERATRQTKVVPAHKQAPKNLSTTPPNDQKKLTIH